MSIEGEPFTYRATRVRCGAGARSGTVAGFPPAGDPHHPPWRLPAR